MSLTFTRTNFITGSYAGDLLLLLEIAENNPLRLLSINNPNTVFPVQKDSVGRAVIGYGYDLAANAAQSIAIDGNNCNAYVTESICRKTLRINCATAQGSMEVVGVPA